MKETTLYRVNNFYFPILIACFIAVRLVRLESKGAYIILVILVIFFFASLYDFLKTKSVSFDDQNIYLQKFKKRETVPFENVLSIDRSIFRSYRLATRNFGYTINYVDESGNGKSCWFYLPLTKFHLWETLKSKLMSANGAIVISE
jgi:hypothetical protein